MGKSRFSLTHYQDQRIVDLVRITTAHVPTHSMGSSIYALQAIYRATNSSDVNAAIAKERNWKYQHLLKLKKKILS